MKTFFSTIALMSLYTTQAFAHGGGEEVAGSADAGWQGPVIAILIIVISVVVARSINKKQRSQ